MQDRPTAAELLRDIADTLDGRILPLLSGGEQHLVRVAANLCRILEREVELAPALEAQERALLLGLLPGAAVDAPAAELDAGLARLVATTDDRQLLARAREALVTIVEGKLAVNKPGYAAGPAPAPGQHGGGGGSDNGGAGEGVGP
ncbi:MAG: DUF6285 domain-containing protein [Acidimicrobiales bacterium]